MAKYQNTAIYLQIFHLLKSQRVIACFQAYSSLTLCFQNKRAVNTISVIFNGKDTFYASSNFLGQRNAINTFAIPLHLSGSRVIFQRHPRKFILRCQANAPSMDVGQDTVESRKSPELECTDFHGLGTNASFMFTFSKTTACH